MLELVVFDVDGLMIDSESVWKEAFDKAGDKYGISNLGDALFSKLVGKRLEDERKLSMSISQVKFKKNYWMSGEKLDFVHWKEKYQ